MMLDERSGGGKDGGAHTGLAHEVLVAVPPDGGSLLIASRSEEAVGAGRRSANFECLRESAWRMPIPSRTSTRSEFDLLLYTCLGKELN